MPGAGASGSAGTNTETVSTAALVGSNAALAQAWAASNTGRAAGRCASGTAASASPRTGAGSPAGTRSQAARNRSRADRTAVGGTFGVKSDVASDMGDLRESAVEYVSNVPARGFVMARWKRAPRKSHRP